MASDKQIEEPSMTTLWPTASSMVIYDEIQEPSLYIDGTSAMKSAAMLKSFEMTSNSAYHLQ